MCSQIDGLSSKILEKAYESHYSIHLCLTKMNHDLREVYWGKV